MGNSTRFKVFERDGYTCRYCGQKPPDVVLEVDHFIPVKEGGDNQILNLLTSCKQCNSGKKARISRSPDEAVEYKAIIEDKKEIVKQLKRIRALSLSIEFELESMVDTCSNHWEYLHDGEKVLNIRGRSTIRTFLSSFTANKIMEAMDISFTRTNGGSVQEFKYMCGILQNWKKGITEKPENNWATF